ncbi:MAG: AAA family ATPase [Clostridiales bacterium]|jgi:hypothetical protein|nr:AAA family ATPase [Clostridiales bacterium]
MLLQFAVQNYKTIRDEVIFSMLAEEEDPNLSYSLFHRAVGKEDYKIMSSSVVAGPNASGKTNLFSAMDTLRSIVLRGNILNAPDSSNPNKAAHTLELIPNAYGAHEPVAFYIAFIENEMMVEYSLAIDLGPFMALNFERKVVSEELLLNNEVVFKREGDNITLGQLDHMSPLLNSRFVPNIVAYANLESTELFLVNSFKSLCSTKLASLIKNWFEQKLIIVFSDNKLLSDPRIPDYYKERTLNEAVSHFGASNSIFYVQEKSGNKLVSKVNDLMLLSENFESLGTLRFSQIFPLIIKAYDIGATLVIDEFAQNLHADGVFSIINAFHNDDFNVKESQLIFNTQNLVYLNQCAFRKDELKIMDAKDGKGSELYSVADFEVSESDDTYDCYKNYLRGLYGVFKEVEYETIFCSLAERSNNAKEVKWQ